MSIIGNPLIIGDSGGGGNVEANKTATLTGGTTVINPSSGYDSMAKVTATVPEIQMSPTPPSTTLNTTWYLNDTLSNLSALSGLDVQFTFPGCNSEYYYFEPSGSNLSYYYDGMGLDPDPEDVQAYTLSGGWADDAYRRITIIGGYDVSSQTFITWLSDNALTDGTSADFSATYDVDAGVVEVKPVDSGYLDSSTDDGVAIVLPIEAHDPPTRSGPSSSSGLVSISHTQAAGFTLGGTSSTSFTLTTKGAQTYTPTTTDQTIPAGRWLTGVQTIKGISFSTIRTGSGAPSSSLGVDGDIYIQTS